jgi:hypothetical protein
MGRAFLGLCLSLVVMAASATAQTKSPTPPRAPAGPRVDLSVGAGFLGGSGLGDADADLRGRGGQALELFSTTSRLGASVPLEVRVGFPFGSRYAIELRGIWARPEIQTTIGGDFEGAPGVTVAERINLYGIEAGLLVAFAQSRPRTLVPFLSGGAGVAGAVHEGLTLLETGVSYRGGGGLKYPLAMRTRGRLKTIGIRTDAALVVMTGGVATGSGATRQVTASGSFYLTF